MTAVAPALRMRHVHLLRAGVAVLDDVSFALAPGALCALVGDNGSGKSTLLRVAATLVEPTAGRVQVCGVEASRETSRARALLGYLGPGAGAYPSCTVREYLGFFAQCHGIDVGVVDGVLELTELEALAARAVGELSAGHAWRAQLARLLLHDPQLLLLDEPAAPLDPRARRELYALLAQLSALGKTVLLASHALDELESVCTSALVLVRGRVRAQLALEPSGAARVGAFEQSFLSLTGPLEQEPPA